MKSNKLKIAVAGCGYWGKNLLRNFWELGYLSAIYDTDEDRINEFKTKYSGIRIIPSFEELLKDKEIDGVVIAAPAVFHHSMVKEALLNNKHVFVEKPLALNINDGKELVDLANEKKKILMVGHILQYHNAVIRLKELIDSGELGKIQYIYSNRLNIGKIRSEENILWSFAPHDISVILGLLDEMPESVCASGGNYLQNQVADVTLTTMNFPSGVKAHIFVSWLHPFKEQKLVIVGSKKMAVFDDLSEEKLFLYSHSVNWINRLPIACKSDAEIVPVTMEEPLKMECQHFIDCIKNERVPITSGDEGLRVLTVLEAAQKSLNNSGQISYIKENGAVKEEKSYFVHETSYVDENVKIGAGTKIWHFSHILKNSTIGDNCKIGQNVVIGPYVTIGNGCKIQNNISIYEGVTLEDEVFCGPSMVFTNVFNPRSAIVRMSELRPTLVKKGATIGANATIVCGNTIGRYAFIGAGAVVIEDVPDYALVVGNPARIIGWICECGIKLKMQIDNNQEILICEKCNKRYINENGVISNL